MSRDDDFNFDDPFGDDDDLFGGGDDDFGGFDDNSIDDMRGFDNDSMFDDDDPGFDMDDNLTVGGGDDFDDDFFADEGETENTGPNRTFIILAGVMIVVFLIGLVLIAFLATRPAGEDPVEQTRVAILDFNATQEAFANQTATQSALNQTQEAEELTADQTATQIAVENETQVAIIAATQTAEAAANVTPTPNEAEIEETSRAQTALAVINNTETPTPIPTEPVEATPIAQPTSDTNAVAQTATALAVIIGGGDATPTQEVGIGTAAPTIAPTQGDPGIPGGNGGGTGGTGGQLPETGFFDDGGGVGLLAVIALALVAVIFGARRLRTANAS